MMDSLTDLLDDWVGGHDDPTEVHLFHLYGDWAGRGTAPCAKRAAQSAIADVLDTPAHRIQVNLVQDAVERGHYEVDSDTYLRRTLHEEAARAGFRAAYQSIEKETP